MNKVVLIFLFSVLALTCCGQHLVELWRTDKVMKSPESVLYDSKTKKIFVANINGNSGEKDGNGFISQLKQDGTIEELYWVKGLNAPKGMAISGHRLYVADIDELVEINTRNAKIVHRYHVPDAIFLNDVAGWGKKRFFVSDSRANKIYFFNRNNISKWLVDGSFNKINGLFIEGDTLYVGSEVIHKIDIKIKKIEIIQEDCGGIDGLEKDQIGNFIFSNWVGRIYYRKENQLIKVLDLTKEKINTADINWAKKLNILLVPTFLDNRVIAYKLDYAP